MSKPAGVHLFTVERTVSVLHYAPQKALVSVWESLCTPQFREALMRGMDECQRLGAKSWIIDMTRDPGVPSQDDQNWIETFNAENAVRKGVVACINIHGASALQSSRGVSRSRNCPGAAPSLTASSSGCPGASSMIEPGMALEAAGRV